MSDKKLVLPGDRLASGEEAVSGENTYEDKDEVYSAAAGIGGVHEGTAQVKGARHTLVKPHKGMKVYCLIRKTSPNKAVADCISVEQGESKGSAMPITAVLPVTGLGKRGYVEDLRSEVRIGDVIAARVIKADKKGVDVAISSPDCGFLAVFCPRDRKRMDYKGDTFICSDCGWKERRKIPREGNETQRDDYGSQDFGQ